MNNSSKSFLPALTGIRAIAAYLVFIYHFTPSPSFIGQTLYNFLHEFHVGVTLFFVLSGFIITYNYFEKINSLKMYFVNRFSRIFPMYFILTTFTFVFFAIQKNLFLISDFKEFLSCISFLKGFSPNLRLVGISQGWTLTVEESFYLMAPLIFLFIKRSKIYLIIIPIIIILTGFGIVNLISIPNSFEFINSNNFMLLFTFFGRCFEFFVGIGIALFYKANKKEFKTKMFTYFGVIVILLSILILSFLKTDQQEGIYHPLGIIVNNFILPIFGIAPLYLGLLFENTGFKKFLSTKTMILLGKSSYIFYLIHMGVFVNILSQITTNNFFLFLIINIFAILIFKYLEEPISILVKRKFKNSEI